MSGGQQQRVAIARAIVGDRRLILADEPTGALDTETGEEILRLLRARCDAGAAGVLVTHEARHAAWADRVVFLRDGVVVDESGTDPAEPCSSRDGDEAGPGLALGSLRMAWRDAWRSKGRSILVLVMIALPVLAVTAADVVIATADVTGPRRSTDASARADARVTVERRRDTVVQGPTRTRRPAGRSSDEPSRPPGLDDVERRARTRRPGRRARRDG